MIGRESDLEALRAELAEASAGSVDAGRPRAVVIGGEAGIGKSRLLGEFLAESEGAATVLLGRCVDLGSDGAPYAPFAAVVRRLIQQVGLDTVLRAAGPGAGVLSALLPELADDSAVPARTGAERLYEVVTVLFETLSAERPLILAVEDVHWADGSTLELLRFIVRMTERGRVLVLLTYRSDEVSRGHPLRSYLAELERTRRVTRWELARLQRDQVAALIEHLRGGEPDLATVDRVYALSEGVPFFVEELVGIDGLDTGEELPETLRELLLARYERLGDGAQRLLRVLSAGGVCVEHDLLVAVYDGSPDELDAAAREAVVANVLTAEGTEYSFRHALVREAIHADLLPGERARFHTRYAEALEASPQRSAIQLSSHWLAAHDLRRAFLASVEGMDEARLSYAYATSAAMGDRVLEMWDGVPDAEQLAGRDRIAVIARTASALRNAGDNERALALVDVALADLRGISPARHARLLRDKAQYLSNLSRPGSAELLEEALAVVPPEAVADGDPLRPHLLTELAARFMIAARYDQAITMAGQAIAEADHAPASLQSVAHNILGSSLTAAGRVEEGLAELDIAGRLADGDANALLRHAVNASDALNSVGRYEDAVRIAEAGAREARRRGVERTSGVMLSSNTAEPLLALGRLDRSAELLDAALALDAPPSFRAQLQRNKLWLTLWRGDVDLAEELLRRWRGSLRILGELEMQARLSIARITGEIALARGDAEQAWREVGGIGAEPFATIPGYDLPVLAVAARALAERAVARRVAGGAASLARAAGAGQAEGDPEALDVSAEALRLETVLAALGDWPTFPIWAPLVEAELASARAVAATADTERARRLVLAVEAWSSAAEASRSPLAPAHLHPYVLLRAARAALAAGDRAAAERLAAAAREEADRFGFGLIASTAAALVAHRGARAVAGAAGGAGAPLTDREEQVLALIEQGLSNKQIGERLFISAKTASVHVSSILRKVGASTRTEAVYRAARAPR